MKNLPIYIFPTIYLYRASAASRWELSNAARPVSMRQSVPEMAVDCPPQGRTQDFLKGGGDFFIYSGEI